MKRALTTVMVASVAALMISPCLAGGEPGQGRRRRPQPTVDVVSETASHTEVAPLAIEFRKLSALRLDSEDRLLACDEAAAEIKVISPAGNQVATWKPGFGPEAIDVAADGTIYCGGRGRLAKLGPDGTVLKSVGFPRSDADAPRDGRRRPQWSGKVSGIEASDRDVFVAIGVGGSLGSKSRIWRLDRDLENPKLIADKVRGCCQRCDIVARDGVVYVAENTRHRVLRFDREGKALGPWGKRSRTDIKGFGSCCNPMNLCFSRKGVLYTSESGMGRVKRYSTDGKFLGLVGYVGVQRFSSAGHTASSCSNIAIAVTRDEKRVYVMDFLNKRVRVLEKKD